jgi:hypothetical protein
MGEPVKLDKNGQRRGGKRPGAGPKRRVFRFTTADNIQIELRDPRPLSLRARDLTHLALAALAKVLVDPEAQGSAQVNAAREVLDRGYGKAVELKRSLTMGAFDGYSDTDLDELIKRLEAIGHAAPVIEGIATQSDDPTIVSGLGAGDRAETGEASSAADPGAAGGGRGQD